jgi:hypothetical protein
MAISVCTYPLYCPCSDGPELLQGLSVASRTGDEWRITTITLSADLAIG